MTDKEIEQMVQVQQIKLKIAEQELRERTERAVELLKENRGDNIMTDERTKENIYDIECQEAWKEEYTGSTMCIMNV